MFSITGPDQITSVLYTAFATDVLFMLQFSFCANLFLQMHAFSRLDYGSALHTFKKSSSSIIYKAGFQFYFSHKQRNPKLFFHSIIADKIILLRYIRIVRFLFLDSKPRIKFYCVLDPSIGNSKNMNKLKFYKGARKHKINSSTCLI